MSELAALLNAQGAVVAHAERGRLPDELRDLPAHAAARLDALRAVDAGTGALQTGGAVVVPKGDTLDAALRRAIAAAYAAVQKIDDEKTLRVVSEVMAGDGQSLALLRLSMNRSPVPDAFETGKAP
jgi:hypothetical protein